MVLGYALYWHTPRFFNPDNFSRNPANIFGEIISLNMFCIHRSVAHSLPDFAPVVIPSL